ncbi:MAG TPA: FCD domain-containing protein [Solirubrobacteraceae bacterium]|jgi:DNA-binding FadR family transcriptional regulator|nr:FCD domain-containing protein [Solirubrobacteraceae bacterium]
MTDIAIGPETTSSLEALFAPVHSQTAFEETVERLGTAIKLGLLEPGTRLPAERELCARLGIARSTLRQALVALGQSGHLRATRGRGGGTFVADPQPPAQPPSPEVLAGWRDVCDARMTVEVGIAVLAAERGRPEMVDALEQLVLAIDDTLNDFPAYRQIDVRFHVGLAELTGSPHLVKQMTETQGAMSNLISHIAHPPEVLDSANNQHRRMVAAIRCHDEAGAAREMTEHLRGTEYILAALLPPI